MLLKISRRTFLTMAGMMGGMGAATDLGMGGGDTQAMGGGGESPLSDQMSEEERLRRKKLLQQGNPDQNGGANAMSPAVMSLFGAFRG